MFHVLLQADAVGAILTGFSLSHDLVVINNCLNGVLEVALIATYFSLSDPLASILKSLLPHINYWMTVRSQLVVLVILQITSMSAHLFR